METFGTIGMTLGLVGFIFGIAALAKITKLVKELKDKGILDKEYK